MDGHEIIRLFSVGKTLPLQVGDDRECVSTFWPQLSLQVQFLVKPTTLDGVTAWKLGSNDFL